jgi:hypothetical protein
MYGLGTWGTSVDAEVYSVAWAWEGSPSGKISNSSATLIGDGVNYGKVNRPFPGEAGTPGEVIFTSGDDVVTTLWAKRADPATALTDDIEVYIYRVNPAPGETTEWELLTIPAAEVTSTWKGWHQYTVFSEDVVGQIEIVVRTLDTAGAVIDTGSVFPGEHVREFSPHRNEGATEGVKIASRKVNTTRGAWTGTGDRRVTT